LHLNKLLNGYKLIRFFFAFSFLFSFVIYGKVLGNGKYELPEVILFIYTITSFALLFYKRVSILEFLLDITFLTAFILFLKKLTPYLSILYLFPIFFYALLSKDKKAYILSFISFIITTFFKFFIEKLSLPNIFLISFLNGFSFFIIAFAGLKLGERLRKEQEYLKKLEEFKRESELYKKLYNISANIAHEIKNPLASISASAQLLKSGISNEKLINIIYEETKRMDNLIKDFLSLSKSFNENKENINLKDFIENLLNSCYSDKEISFFIKDENINIKINKQALESILRNLIMNAQKWAKKKIVISVEKVNSYIYISVEDDGSGVSEELKDRIFEPFFSTNPEGTGLGLAIVKNIVLSYNGDIFVTKSDILGGAKFIVILPLEEKYEGVSS